MAWFTCLTLYVVGKIFGSSFLQIMGAIGVLLFLVIQLYFDMNE
jgi:hypothetical protein